MMAVKTLRVRHHFRRTPTPFVKQMFSSINSRGDFALETGKLIFHSKNCHVYERQYKLVKELLSPQTGSKTPRMAQTMKASEEDQQLEE
jgi:hypothetical protein